MKTKTITRKTLSLLLAFIFIVTLIPVSGTHAAESETVTYLALGDSISTGYGLAGYTSKKQSSEGFTYQIAADLGYTLINKAVDGHKSADILNQLNNPLNANYVSEADLAKADVITITAGGNDMMALLYAKTAELTSNPNDTAASILAKLHNGDREVLAAVINLLTESSDSYILNDPDYQPAINAVITNLNAIVAKIKSINSHAQIVVATQYNPYAEFENAHLANLSLSDVYKGTEASVTALNTAIKDNAVDEENGNAVRYTVADVKAAFDAYTGGEDLYNAQPPAGSTAMNVDFHPTAAGHDVLTAAFKETFFIFTPVPVIAVSSDTSKDTYVKVDGTPINATVKVDFSDTKDLPSDDVKKINDYVNANFYAGTYGVTWMDISVTQKDGGTPLKELSEPIVLCVDMTGQTQKVLGFVGVHDGELLSFEKQHFDGPKMLDIFAKNALDDDILNDCLEITEAYEYPILMCLDQFSTYAIIYEIDAPHECEHTGGTATCKDKAICEICGEEYGGNPPHIDADGNKKCDICDHEPSGSNVDDPTNNDPTNNDPTNNDGLETWVIVLIAVGSALVLAGGGFAVYWFVIRKRRR